MAAKTISRKEIAVLLGVGTGKINQLLRTGAFSLPDPVGKEGYSFVYDRAMVLQLLSYWRSAAEKYADSGRPDPPTFFEVLAGKYDRRELRQGYRKRREASKSTRPKTIKVMTNYAK
jgi:hypothetical protein